MHARMHTPRGTIGADEPADRFGDAVVGPAAAQHHGERFQRVPARYCRGRSRGAERFDQVRFAGAALTADAERLGAADRLEHPERLLRRVRRASSETWATPSLWKRLGRRVAGVRQPCARWRRPLPGALAEPNRPARLRKLDWSLRPP